MINHYNILSSGRLCCLNVRATTTHEKFLSLQGIYLLHIELVTFLKTQNLYSRSEVSSGHLYGLNVMVKTTHKISLYYLKTNQVCKNLHMVFLISKLIKSSQITTIILLLLQSNSLYQYGILQTKQRLTRLRRLFSPNSLSLVFQYENQQSKNTRPLLREPARAPPVPDNRACAILFSKVQSLICTFGLSVLRTPSQKMREALPSGSKLGFKLGQGHAPGPQLKMFY